MLLIIKLFANLLATLNSEVSPKQIAAGFALGALIGLVPIGSLLPTLLLVFSFIVNVNLGMVGFATVVFKLLSFGVDPLANTIGFKLLTTAGLKPFWTQLYNMPVVPYTKFNNTIVMGSLVIGIILFIPLYFLAQAGVKAYRGSIRDKILKLKIVQMLKASTLYKYYAAYRGLTGQ